MLPLTCSAVYPSSLFCRELHRLDAEIDKSDSNVSFQHQQKSCRNYFFLYHHAEGSVHLLLDKKLVLMAAQDVNINKNC